MTQLAGLESSRRIRGGASRHVFIGATALLFAIAAAVTIAWSTSMPAMDGMAMSVWMPPPGRSWPVVAASFLGMWVAMTVAMMLPSLAPTLWRTQEATARAGGARPGLSAAVVGLGYFAAWVAFGAAAFPVGAALAVAGMRQPALDDALPLAAGAVVLLAGCYQLTPWKARDLACCRQAPAPGRPLARGLRLGLDCVRCCGSMMVVLLAIGVMDLRTMAVVAVAITAERLAPAGAQVARAIGVVAIGAGLLLMARAAGLG